MPTFNNRLLNLLYRGFAKQKLKTSKQICKKHKFSYTNFSRHSNGKNMDLLSLIRYLVAAGVLPKQEYVFPTDSWEIFCKLNGIDPQLKDHSLD